MTVELIERAASKLGPLVEEVAFVGGASVPLWITDPGAPPPRPTKDVDVVVEVTTRAAWHEFEARLRQVGFREDTSSQVICRWVAEDADGRELIIDAMPADPRLLGFENRWQAEGLAAAPDLTLPSGRQIRAIPPAHLLATKLEAWHGRGGGDHLRSQDLEDVIALVDGRIEILDEVRASELALRSFIADAMTALLAERRFIDAVYGSAPALDASARADGVILPRLGELASLN